MYETNLIPFKKIFNLIYFYQKVSNWNFELYIFIPEQAISFNSIMFIKNYIRESSFIFVCILIDLIKSAKKKKLSGHGFGPWLGLFFEH